MTTSGETCLFTKLWRIPKFAFEDTDIIEYVVKSQRDIDQSTGSGLKIGAYIHIEGSRTSTLIKLQELFVASLHGAPYLPR